MNQQTHRYTGSYESLIQALNNLKYLDRKHLREDYKKSVRQIASNAGKEDKISNEVANEEKLMEKRGQLHNADLDEIIDFFPRVLQNIKDDISTCVTWENLIKIPGLEDQITLA